MNREIEEMVKVMCCDRKNFKPCKSCKSANPNTKAYCRIEHYAELLCKNGYRKSTDVAREIFDEIEQKCDINGHFEYWAFLELRKRYESEGADDETDT